MTIFLNYLNNYCFCCSISQYNLPYIYLRVTCFGPATIVEVAYQSKAISEKKENADEIAKQNKSEIEQIKCAIKSLEKQKVVLGEKVALLNKEKKLLEDFSACVSAVSLAIQIPFSNPVEQFLVSTERVM